MRTTHARITALESLAAQRRAAGCANSAEGRRDTAALIVEMFARSALLSIDAAGIVDDCEGLGVQGGLHRDRWADAIAKEGDYPAAFKRLAGTKSMSGGRRRKVQS